eukprot:m.23386 g.23386  ORF g.23386 m.23386 type:complete len:749 (+) comp8494_c0_seq1:281-2527(+)
MRLASPWLVLVALLGASLATIPNTTLYLSVGSYGSSRYLVIDGNVQTNNWTLNRLSYNSTILGFPRATAVYEDYIYVADYTDVFTGAHALYRMRLDGSDLTLFVPEVYSIGGMAIDPYLDMLIWSENSYKNGCGCIRAVDLSTGQNLRVLYRPANATEYWKATQIALDTSLSLMFTSWHLLKYTRTGTELIYWVKPNTVDGGITMSDADIGVAIDPVRRTWYGVTHNYGATSGNMLYRSYTLANAPIKTVYHRDYASIGTLALDTITQKLFFLIDYGTGPLLVANLDGSNATLVSSRVPIDNPDDFLVWVALPTVKNPRSCASSCSSNYDCVGAPDNKCSSCVNNTCSPPAICGGACTVASDCDYHGSCPNCLSGVCRPQPSCGMLCRTTSDCATLTDTCPLCIPDRAGELRCQAYPPSDFHPGVYLRTECLQNNYTYFWDCSAVVYNVTSGEGSQASLPIVTKNRVTGAIDSKTSRYFVFVPLNTSMQNSSYQLFTYSYKGLDMKLVKQCTVVYGAVTYDNMTSVGNSVLFDPASGYLLTFNGPNCPACSSCRAVPVDPDTCAILNTSSFPVQQHCPADYSWPATPIYSQTESFCSLNYNSQTPLCSFQCNWVTGNHSSWTYYPDTKSVCASQYAFQLDPTQNMLYILSFGLTGSRMYQVNLTIDRGSLVHPVPIWSGLPYIDSHQFFLSTQPSATWDPTGYKLVFFLSSNTPYVRTTNNTLIFRGPQLNTFAFGNGFYDDSFNWAQ